MQLLPVLTVGVALLGLLVMVLGFMPAPEKDPAAPTRASLTDAARHRLRTLSKRNKILISAGFLVGVLLYIVSGWLVMLIAVPVIALLLPMLFDDGGSKQRIERLTAIEAWTRNLAGLTSAGATLETTLTASLPSCPDPIREEVTDLVARIHARWSLRDALRRFADDMHDPTADLLVTQLMLAASMRGGGLTAALEGLAETIFEETRIRLQVESDRAKPRHNARIITGIVVAVILALPFGGSYLAGYQTPIGQLALAFWIACFIALLFWMRQMGRTRVTSRLLKPFTGGDA